MRERTYSVAVCLALLLLTGTTMVRAEPPTETRVRLTALADRAVAEGRLADALEIWHQLWGIEPTAIRACQIGILSHDLGDYVEGARWLSRCERMRSRPKDQRERELVETWRAALERARRQVGALQIEVPAGTSVTVDGRPTDLNEPVYVLPGPHDVSARLADGWAMARVDVAAGETQTARPEVPAGVTGPSVPVILAGSAFAVGLLTGGIGLQLAVDGALQDRNAAINKARYGCFLSPSSGPCADAEDAQDAADARSGWGTALLVAGVVAAGATATYAVWPRQGDVTVAIVGPGVTVTGTW